jgi:vancomycin resistance protein VanJ
MQPSSHQKATITTWRRIVQLVGGIYLFAIPIWFLLRLIFFDRFWWLALLNTIALYLFLPIAIILPLSLLYRQRQFIFGSLLCCFLLILLFHPLVNPFAKRDRPEQQQNSLTVISFNVLWSNQDYEKIAEMIDAVQPDIIGLQEVKEGDVEALATILAPDYLYFVTHPVNQFHTVGILSRLPIHQTTALPYPPMERGLEVVIQDESQQLRVIVAHLAPNNMPLWPIDQFVATTVDRYTQRAAEVAFLQDSIQSHVMPTLILCDCNMTDTSETYAELSKAVRDSFQERGWGLGHTLFVQRIPLPLQRVDYIWHTEEIEVIDSFIGPDGGSDHLPVIATIQYTTK